MIDRIGQLFITGFGGEQPSREFLDFIASENIGGVILFEESSNPHEKAERSIRKIVAASAEIPFIAVDQEGGRVCRFKGAPAEYPSAADFGRQRDFELFEEHISRSAYYIHSLGVNLLLGPVADLGLNADSKCLEGRTYGSNPARVIPFVERAVKIAKRVGLLSCLKHFPGLGAAVGDPHLETAEADYSLEVFLNRESLSFKAGIDAGADLIMSTHMLLPKIDRRPVTESETIISLVLREKLDFDGVAVTDDLLMKGTKGLGGFGERALKAFNAGHDILLFGSDFRATRQAVDHFKEAFRNGIIDDERLRISLDRISGVKSKLTASMIS
jgi:beta-N-acetylhexosaminidase